MATRLWYLSFVGEEGWRGAAIVPADDGVEAIREAWRRGCNPGGGVAFCDVPDPAHVPEEYVGVLLSVSDLEALDRFNGGDGVAVGTTAPKRTIEQSDA